MAKALIVGIFLGILLFLVGQAIAHYLIEYGKHLQKGGDKKHE